MRFELSKISTVTLHDHARRQASWRRAPFGAVGYGKRTFGWQVPRKRGHLHVTLRRADLAGNATRATTTVRVLKPKKKKRP